MRDTPLKTPNDLADFINLAERFKGRPQNLILGLVALAARGVALNGLVEGQTVMNRALSTQRPWLVEALLAAGADPMAPSSGVPAFRAAVAWNEIEAAIAMLESGRVDVNHVDSRGNQAIHCAASNGNLSLMKALMAHGAQALSLNSVGENALDVYERLHARHALQEHSQAARQALTQMEPQARINLFEESWESPSATPRPGPRF